MAKEVIARSIATKQSHGSRPLSALPVIARASARSNLINTATYGIASSAFGLLAMTNGAFFKGIGTSNGENTDSY
jgi:hypothetical protein